MRKIIGFQIVVASLAVLLASCGGGGSSSSSSSTSVIGHPQGVYKGTGQFASGAGNTTFMLVENDDRYWIMYEDPKVPTAMVFADTGTGVETAETFNAAGDTDYTLLYDDQNNGSLLPSGVTSGSTVTGYTLSMDYTNEKQIDGSVLNGNKVISVIVPLFVTASNSSMASLSDVAGKFSGNVSSTLYTSALQTAACHLSLALTIGSNGKINGTLDDCSGAGLPSQSTVTGTLTPRTDILAFDVSLTFTADGSDSAPLDGKTYTGVAYYDASTQYLHVVANTPSGTNAIGFVAKGPN